MCLLQQAMGSSRFPLNHSNKHQYLLSESLFLSVKSYQIMLKHIKSHYRRKFGSQTSDNMDRGKAEMGRVREEKRRRKKIKTEKVSEKKKIQVREKVGKPRNSVFCQWFAAPDGQKVGSLKRWVRSHLADEMKSCTPLWRYYYYYDDDGDDDDDDDDYYYYY